VKGLTKVQKKVIKKKVIQRWESAYDLKASLATLDALYNKKLLDRKCTLGYLAFPRNCIFYRLTDLGQEVQVQLRESEKDSTQPEEGNA
jgi:hypothetical protein